MSWDNFTKSVQTGLSTISFQTENKELIPEDAFLFWQNLGENTRNNGNNLFLIGNGASAAMASHYATDLGKNALLKTLTFSDASLLTALGNDIDFSHIFSEPISRLGHAGDMLITISSSGNSPNIIRAINTARSLNMIIITLSAMKKDNKSRTLGDLNIYAPVQTYGLAETIHAAILHHWTDCMVLSWKNHLKGKSC